ncbi:MAG TPA: ABC transporter substrate-binding protein [Mycobacteriales bacterium]
MSRDYSRRQFLSGGLTTAAGLVLVGGGAGGLLTACGSSNSSSKPGGGSTSGQITGRSSATPRRGGTLRMGLESDFNSFSPATGQFDTAGLMYASTVFDTLMSLDAQGNPQPYLAQTMTPDAQKQVWTMTLRPGVVFHDNTPLTSAEVVNAIQAVQKAALTGPALLNLDTVKATDGMTVVFTCKSPWPAFPTYLCGQLGYVPTPKTLSDPKGGLHPVGTGPFVFEEWVPGSHFYANANKNYWRKGLPYVDRVEYNTMPDSTTRDNSLLAGTVDIIHSSDSISLHDVPGKPNIEYLTDADNNVGEPSMDMSMINCMDPVMSDIRVRQALAYSFNADLYQKVHNFGLYKTAYGLFPGNPTYASSTKLYPTFDLAKAKSLVQAYEAEKGKLKIQYSTTNSTRNAETAQFLQQQWGAAGIDVSIQQVEQVQLITNALLGKFQVTAWRQFAAPNPDANYVWWSIPTSAPIGQSSLNFARNRDQQVQDALQTGRTSLDEATRTAAYNTVNERFAKDLPYIFANRTTWGCYANKKVQNFNGLDLPGGQPALSFSGGLFYPMCTWLSA